MHNPPDDKRTILSISNRWVNTVYTDYGVIKQRILLQILEQLKPSILKVMNGTKVDQLIKPGDDIIVPLDMSTIIHYNNYSQVRKAVKEMSEQAIEIYWDPAFKAQDYRTAPLLDGYERTTERKIINLRIKHSIAVLLLHVDYGKLKKSNKYGPYQYTQFDAQTITYSSCKYMMPMYTLIRSYSEKQGFDISVEELRLRLQVPDKYKGFDPFNRFILKHLQKELQIFGGYGFNFSQVKSGKKVVRLVFKIFANTKFDYNHVWLKIQRALHEELPHYMRFTEEQFDKTNYLLTGAYDLHEVLAKLQHIHKALVKKKDAGEKLYDVFAYFIKALHRDFPPPS